MLLGERQDESQAAASLKNLTLPKDFQFLQNDYFGLLDLTQGPTCWLQVILHWVSTCYSVSWCAVGKLYHSLPNEGSL